MMWIYRKYSGLSCVSLLFPVPNGENSIDGITLLCLEKYFWGDLLAGATLSPGEAEEARVLGS